MASVVKLFHDILRNLCFTRHFRFFRRWALFLAFLSRRLSVWRPIWRLWDDQERGAFPKGKPAQRSSSCTGPNLGSREYVAAASCIPPSATRSASGSSILSSTIQQPRATVTGAPLPPTQLSVDLSNHQDHVNPSSVLDTRTDPNRGRSTDSTHSSVQRRSSDRAAIIQTHFRESLPTLVGQPTPFPRAPPRQFARRPSLPALSGELSRSPSPTPQLPPFEIDVTMPHHETQDDRRNNLISSTPIISHGNAQPNPPSIHGDHKRKSPTSVVVEVSTPLTESYTIGSPTSYSSIRDTVDLREGSSHIPQATTSDSFPPSFTTLDSGLNLPAGCFMAMIHSEQVPRFTKSFGVPRERTHYEILPLTTSFPYISDETDSEQDPHLEDCAPWVPATHPDGALYFFDQERRLFTDTNMLDPILREEMEAFYQYIQRIMRYEDIVIASKNYDLTLDVSLSDEDGQIMWSYYFACHEARCLFWFDTYDATYMISERLGARSPAHIKHRLESLYWTHWSLFPAVFEGRRLHSAAVDELIGTLTHGCMDVMTSKSESTLPFDGDTMQKMLALVRDANKSDANLVYHTAAVSRLLSTFAHWRFLYFHGQVNARLERHQTAYTDVKRKRTLLISLISPLLFLAPEGYLRELEKEWVDEVIIEANWRNFISGLLKEWELLILFSTVMLTANVGFLAIPGVVIADPNSTGTDQVSFFTSPANASFASIVTSAGSIVIGLLLVRRTSPKQNEGPAGASESLYKNTHRIFGLEQLAIEFSLPWAFLMWSMVNFFYGLLLFCISSSNTGSKIGNGVSLVVAIPFLQFIGSTWGSTNAVKVWFSGLLQCIKQVPDDARAVYHRILASIDFGSRPDREGVRVVV
ncbi:hypothetical protein EI94DRAFT_1747257 [Lactarius quietus]|nr:hypothetical protein EI94DRAFT_1747257 [Lactarius quietus]